jgi:hypothetical protein
MAFSAQTMASPAQSLKVLPPARRIACQSFHARKTGNHLRTIRRRRFQ